MEVSEKVRNISTAVKYFVGNYGEKLTNALKVFSNVCWKRAALIIGHALAGIPIVPRSKNLSMFLPEDLRKSFVESLGDALKECGVDYYLLVGNVIPSLVRYVTKDHAYALAEAFVDKYDEVVAEVRRILNIARGRGCIYDAERLYGLGLASIIANAARFDRDVKSSDADIALRIAPFAIKSVAWPYRIKSVLGALEPLYGKAPHRYLALLALASDVENLDRGTVRYVFDKLNEILDNYGDMVREHAWSLVYAISAYTNLLRLHRVHFDNNEVKGAVGRIADLLNGLGKSETSLGVIAWAYALAPALRHGIVRRHMEEKLGIDVFVKACEVLKELNDMKERVQELMSDEKFLSYIESRSVKADEEAVRRSILGVTSLLKHALAIYRLGNDELDEAEKLINEVAEKRREIGDYKNYLVERSWISRIETIEGSLDSEKLVNEFRLLYEETFSKEHFKLTAKYLSTASYRLSEYLVSLALTGNYEMIKEIPEDHWLVLNADKEVSVLTRLMLKALLSPRGGLSSELEGKLSVNPEELIDAFRDHMLHKYLPALRVAFEIVRPEDGYKECKSIKDSMERKDCEDAVSAVMKDSDAVWRLRGKLIDYFHKRILKMERSGWLRELGFAAKAMISEFEKLVYGLDGKSLIQLLAIRSSAAQLALLLHALINGNEELAKAHALYGAICSSNKLLGRLFLEVYKECRESCDLDKDELRRAIARLFFLHV
jgi:hypothetical protein